MKKKISRWKCSVCKHIEEASERPEKCKDCGAQPYKIKILYERVRRHSHADEPEVYD